MKRLSWLFCLCLLLAATAAAHDLFIKLDDYVLKPDASTVLRLMSRTFRLSENVVARDRMVDASFLLPSGERLPLNAAAWRDERTMAAYRTKLAMPGTYGGGRLAQAPRDYAESSGV